MGGAEHDLLIWGSMRVNEKNRTIGKARRCLLVVDLGVLVEVWVEVTCLVH